MNGPLVYTRPGCTLDCIALAPCHEGNCGDATWQGCACGCDPEEPHPDPPPPGDDEGLVRGPAIVDEYEIPTRYA